MDLVKNTRFFRENRKSMGRFDINYFTLNAVVARKSSSGKHTNHIFEFHGCWVALNNSKCLDMHSKWCHGFDEYALHFHFMSMRYTLKPVFFTKSISSVCF